MYEEGIGGGGGVEDSSKFAPGTGTAIAGSDVASEWGRGIVRAGVRRAVVSSSFLGSHAKMAGRIETHGRTRQAAPQENRDTSGMGLGWWACSNEVLRAPWTPWALRGQRRNQATWIGKVTINRDA